MIAVVHRRHRGAVRGIVASQVVGPQPPRFAALLFQKAAKEAFGRFLMTSDQVSDAFDQALEDCPGPTSSPKNTVPQDDEDGSTPQDFIDCAIEQAKVVDTVTNAFLGVGKGPDDTGTGTVTSVPAGIDCGTECSEIYPIDTPVVLTATEDPGSPFAGWFGACEAFGTDMTCILMMDGDKATTAFFTANEEPPPTPTPTPTPTAASVAITSASCTLVTDDEFFKQFEVMASGTASGVVGIEVFVSSKSTNNAIGAISEISCTAWSGRSFASCSREQEDPAETNWTAQGTFSPSVSPSFNVEIEPRVWFFLGEVFAVASTTVTCQ